jgi:hypothetical protein
MIYVVLGMHKSGTTLISETLHESGINMGEFSDIQQGIGYDEGHKYERRETQQINRQILDGVLKAPFDLFWFRSRRGELDAAGYVINDDAAALVDVRELERRLSSQPHQRQIDDLVARLQGHYSDWGFKDPRTCLTYPLWASSLPEHRLVLVYRHFDPLLHRMLNLRRHKIPLINCARTYAILQGWLVSNLYLVQYAKHGSVPFILLNYERFMSQPEGLERLRAFTGKDLADRRKKTMYRRQAGASSQLPLSVRMRAPRLPTKLHELWRTLESMADDRPEIDDAAPERPPDEQLAETSLINR